MVEIRGKLADVNDDKAAHSLSAKKAHFSAFARVRKQWRDRHLLAVVWEELVLIKRRRKR